MAKRIFVLEDDQGISEIVEMVLESEGYQVSCFSNVASFNAALSAPPADLYLLDIMLPDGNGLEVRKSLSQNELTSKQPVLVMSAHTNSPEDINWPGPQYFIAKPFDIAELTERIASLIKD
ncbi:response regulator transcription factor [Pedobacter sp. Leaf176]|uniref:response regulator transcription factor n=1 Tax=Pedobacter sp. Leaf176 TaxID=1736286 RepID=UPI0006F82AD3|nr:response regulator [Pedobacter sp. Leaf176]KQR70147.1 hypothetical protein ASF92_09090 [Pedobacter sp. Leaf176]